MEMSNNHVPTTSAVPSLTSNTTVAQEDDWCKWILYLEIGSSRVRVWDVAILIPNFMFLVYLVSFINRARLKLKASSSPIFSTFYALVLTNVSISVVRCVVSMTVNASLPTGDRVDKTLWIVVRFFLLSSEISVVVFGLAFGHLESRTSIRRVLLVTSTVSLLFSVTQGVLEFITPDENFYIASKDFNLFAHGGMLFWFISSLIFTLVYSLIFVLPWTPIREHLLLPSKRSFYYYVGLLGLLDLCQSLGSCLLYAGIGAGLCLVDVTSYIYFTLVTPLIYYTFLSEFFGTSPPTILFSYKTQIDDTVEEDSLSMPHHQSFSSLKTDSDIVFQDGNRMYDITQFDAATTPINPLYAASLQSPDSFTGYSIHSIDSVN